MSILDFWGIEVKTPNGTPCIVSLRQILQAVAEDEQAGNLLRDMLFPRNEYRALTPEEMQTCKIDGSGDWLTPVVWASLPEDAP